VIIDIMDKNFVLITGPPEVTGVRRRRANINHLEPTDIKLNITKTMNDEEIKKILVKPEAKPKQMTVKKPETQPPKVKKERKKPRKKREDSK